MATDVRCFRFSHFRFERAVRLRCLFCSTKGESVNDCRKVET